MTDFKFTTQWFEATALGYWAVLQTYVNNKFGNNANCLDVGTYEGRSAVWMAENLIGTDGELHIVDPMKGNYVTNLEHNLKLIERQFRVITHAGDSVIELPKLLSGRGEFFHFIYIDAGKTATDNCLNALLCERLLVVGGLLIIDDYLWSDGSSDIRRSPKFGIDVYSNLTMLTKPQNTPRTQAVFTKTLPNEILYKANL